MTPLRGLFRRLKGETTPALDAPSPQGDDRRGKRAAVAQPATGGGPILAGDEPRKRRRGRRGGRNRRRDGDAAQTGTSEAPRSERDGRGSPGDSAAEDPRRRRSETPSTSSSTTTTSSTGRPSGRNGRNGGNTRTSSARGGSANGRSNGRSSDNRNDSRTEGRGNGRASTEGQPAAKASRERYDWGRRVDPSEADERVRRANRRRRDVRARNLDAPLPEDIAFRPGDEGGDSTILPSRRRRPTGLHDTARVLVGGARTLGAWVKREDAASDPSPAPGSGETLPETPRSLAPRPSRPTPARVDRVDEAASGTPEGEAAAEDLEAAEAVGTVGTDTGGTDTGGTDTGDAETDGDAPRKRRRRGRRGGRGRRRPGAEAGTPEDEADLDADEADDLDRDDDEYEDAASRAVQLDQEDQDLDHEDLDHEDEAADDADEPAPRPRRAPRTRRAAPPAVAEEDLPAAFAKLGIHRRTLEALARFGFQEPTPIQEEAVPALLNGLDVVGIAQTGSGKTVAFGVPMVERLDAETPEVQGIVLVPTRELAQQVLEVLSDLAEPWGLEAVGLLGGRSLKADFRALEGRPHIVVGTPGRILDHLRRQTLSLRHVRYAVLDEADQMLDIGFLPDIRRILSRTPQRRQTALFSATMPGSIKRLIWQFMTDPETVRVDAEATPVDTIAQVYFEVANRDKVRAMRELIERELKGRTLIFCNMKRGVDHLARELGRDGVRVGALHGDMDQRRRDQVVREFREGALDVLIATNVAARGLDIPEITHVVNYDVPQNLEEYVHRIGRTGRAGREGKAITFVCEWDVDAFDVIRNDIGVDVGREELDLYGRAVAADPALGESLN